MLKVRGGSLLCIKYNFCAVHRHFLMDTRTWQILLTSCKRHKDTTNHHYNSISMQPDATIESWTINDVWGAGNKAVQDTPPKQRYTC